MTNNSSSKKPMAKRRKGSGLLIAGLLITVLFVVFMFLGQDPGQGLKTPVWIGVAFGGIMALFGLYRMVKGPSPLDHPGGGTNSEPEA